MINRLYSGLSLLALCSALWLLSTSAAASNERWADIQQQARGQTVYFYAWGGSAAVNDYLRWAARELDKVGVRLRHVKIADISSAISRLRAENGRPSAIDLMWVNGENFHFLKSHHLLLPDLWERLPNSNLLATDTLPLETDFGEPVDGLEAPWGVGQFNLIVKQGILAHTAITPERLLEAAKAHPNRLSYPKPPEFHGTTLLKQLLLTLTEKDPRLYQPVTDDALAEVLPPLWNYLDSLHPLLWRQGQSFPSSATEQTRLYKQDVLANTVSFNPNEMFKHRHIGLLPRYSQRHYFASGAITNSHYLAIPKTAQSRAGTLVTINFLLTHMAQEEKLTGDWGDPPVIQSLLEQAQLLPAADEFHSSWQQALEHAWLARYGG